MGGSAASEELVIFVVNHLQVRANDVEHVLMSQEALVHYETFGKGDCVLCNHAGVSIVAELWFHLEIKLVSGCLLYLSVISAWTLESNRKYNMQSTPSLMPTLSIQKSMPYARQGNQATIVL